ncbi:NUDIX hydrolase [Catellatospora vulcania]|uniref:hypothetical protein n=1 Tax=Catellatospora vulcania TaxID=1460450 RepID=UPI0012D393CD|nr:hypothetical protein [Catellatospora vulcania]
MDRGRRYAIFLHPHEVPQLIEYAEFLWLAAHELHTVPWLPADAAIVAALPKFMGDGA